MLTKLKTLSEIFNNFFSPIAIVVAAVVTLNGAEKIAATIVAGGDGSTAQATAPQGGASGGASAAVAPQASAQSVPDKKE